MMAKSFWRRVIEKLGIYLGSTINKTIRDKATPTLIRNKLESKLQRWKVKLLSQAIPVPPPPPQLPLLTL